MIGYMLQREEKVGRQKKGKKEYSYIYIYITKSAPYGKFALVEVWSVLSQMSLRLCGISVPRCWIHVSSTALMWLVVHESKE